MIRSAEPRDAAAICSIYNHYIENTTVTFEMEALDAGQMQTRIAAVQENYPWLVWEQDGMVVGYAYANEWKARAAFRYTAETSIYLHPSSLNNGIGSSLYQELLDQLHKQGMHLLVAAITLPNPQSIALHKKLGFTEMGSLVESGRKFDRWIDVGYWQLRL